MANTKPASASRSSRSMSDSAGKTRSSGDDGDNNIVHTASEMLNLTRDYAKQEIQDPLKSLGNYVLWGGVAWLLLGVGCLMLSIGLLRALQTETGSTFTGSLSFVPYAIVLVTAAVVLGIAAAILTKRKR